MPTLPKITFENSKMSEENVSRSDPCLAARHEEGEGGGSRSSSPDPGKSAEILEHSLESLIVSDSSEECTAAQGFEAEGSAEQLVMGESSTGGVNADTDEEAVEAKEVAKEPDNKADSKRKKRRISSRRTRRVKLSTSDIVLCEVAGVQVGTDDVCILDIDRALLSYAYNKHVEAMLVIEHSSNLLKLVLHDRLIKASHQSFSTGTP